MTMTVKDMSHPMVSLRNVGVCYKRKARIFRRSGEELWALKDVSLDLYQGEVLGVIGRNGAGKTTLMKLISGIIRPDRGTLTHNGSSASLLSLQVGFIPYLTGRENAILSGMLLGLKRSDVNEMMSEIISFSELGEFIDEPINTYSAGMKARLGFSVAFQIDPDILLIDEVLGVGDADFKVKSSAVLHDKIRSEKAVVLVTHSAAMLRQLCDKSVWIENGVTQAEGDTESVLEAYERFLKGWRKC